MLAFQSPGPCRELRDGDPAGWIDKERDLLQFLRDSHQFPEIVIGDHAAADLLGRDLGLLGNDTRGQLLRRHFEGIKPDAGAFLHLGPL